MEAHEHETPYTHWRTIVFGDTDPAGIVYTPRFSDYCMEAVEIWLSDYIGVNWARINLDEGRGTPVVNMELSFISPVEANDRLGVVVYVEKIGRSSLTVTLRGILDKLPDMPEVHAFDARFVYCFTDENRRAMAIPADNRDRLEAYMKQGGAGSN